MVASPSQEHVVRKIAIVKNRLYIVDVEKAVSLWRYIL